MTTGEKADTTGGHIEIDEKAFAEYLRRHPDFFQRHASLLGQLVIPHPTSGRTVSLLERQVMVLREQVDATQKQLRELIGNARANDRLGQRAEELALYLLGQRSLDQLMENLTRTMRRIFDLEYVSLCEPGAPGFDQVLGERTEAWCSSHPAPEHCEALFGDDASDIRSFAGIPLRRGKSVVALLALGSSDSKRYEAASGTRFLAYLQRLLSASITQLDAIAGP